MCDLHCGEFSPHTEVGGLQHSVWTDSNAAKAIASKRGLEKTRHEELKYLRLQEVTKSGRLKVRRVPGEQNLADHLTKGKSWREIHDSMRVVGGRMQVSQGNKGNEHGWKQWQGR